MSQRKKLLSGGCENQGFEPDTVSGHKDTSSQEDNDSIQHRSDIKNKQEKEKKENEVKLKRELGLCGGISLIVGTMIGAGIFVSPGGVLQGSGSVGMSMIIWGLCGVVSCLGAICYIELGCLIPQSGGELVYIKGGLGDIPSFLNSWTKSIVLQPSSCAIIALTFSEYAMSMVPRLCDIDGRKEYWTKRLLALSAIFFITFVNAWSVKMANKMQITFTVAKLAIICVIIIGGIVRIAQGYTQHLALANGFQLVPGTEFSAGSVALAFYSGLWAYDGWNQLNFVTEELQEPMKNLPRALLLGIPLVSVSYILVNLSYLTVLSPADISTSPAVGMQWATEVLGVMSWLLPVSVALSTFGALNGTLFTAGRLCYAASKEGHLPQVISYVHIERLTPAPALIFNTVMAVLFTLLSNIGDLINFFSFTAWIFYGATMLSLVVMRWTRPDADRPFRVWLPIPVGVFLLSIYLVIVPIIRDPAMEYLYVFCFIFSGLLLYVPCVYFNNVLPGMQIMTVFLQKLLKIVPPAYDD